MTNRSGVVVEDQTEVSSGNDVLTLSLEENFIQRGSSLITFFTSFQVVVKVIYNTNVSQ